MTYAWAFGDGGASTDASPSHTFASAGDKSVTLVVTDNKGATGSVTHTVTPTATAAATLIASDAFGRSVSNGWGSADLGGSWTRPGTAANYSVAGGQGRLSMNKGSGPAAYLDGVSSTDTDTQVSIGTDKAATGGGVIISVIGRRVAGAGDYRAKVHLMADGSVKLGLSYVRSDNVEVAAVGEQTIAGLSYTPGMRLQVRLQVTGTSPTTIRASVWASGGVQPTNWQVSATDSSAGMQASGGVGLVVYLSGTATTAPVIGSFDDLKVYRASTVPAAMALRAGATRKLTAGGVTVTK